LGFVVPLSGTWHKNNVARCRENMKEWKKFVSKLVRDTPRTVLHALWNSMPDRRDALIAASGGPINY